MASKKIFTALLIIAVLTASAHTYSLLGMKWKDINIPVAYYINTANCPLDAASSQSAVINAFNIWGNVASTKMSFNYLGNTSKPVLAIDYSSGELTTDGYNIVGWDNVSFYFGFGTLGVTLLWASDAAPATILEADIALDTYGWFSTASVTPSNKIDLHSVILHEIGHLVGLDHVADTADLMYEALSFGEMKRSLSQDCVNGISFLYPGSKQSGIPANLTVQKSAPNPFKPRSDSDFAVIPFLLNTDSKVTLRIFNMSGEMVKTLIDRDLPAGSYLGSNAFKWYGDNGNPDGRGSGCASGVYIYQFKTNHGDTFLGKIMLIR